MTYPASRPLAVAFAVRRGLRLAVLALFVMLWALVFSAAAVANTTPTVPANVQAVAGTTSPLIARITWNASTDDLGVTGYNVWRSLTSTGTPSLIGSTVGLRFDDVRGVPGQPYFYMVSAFDGGGLESTRSAPVGPVRSTWVPLPHVAYTTAGNLCVACHAPHEAATARGLLRPTTGTMPESSVCFACHDGSGASTNIRTGPTNSFALASGHSVEERDTGADLADRCSSCHTAHGNPAGNRMLPRASINNTAVARNNSWCFACHNNTNAWFGTGYPSPATPSRDASGYPVSGRFFGPSIYNSAGANPHSLIPASTIVSPTRQAGDCLYCHESHRSANRYDALRHTYRPPSASTLASDQLGGFAESCFACHGGVTQTSLFTTRPVNIRQFVATSAVALGVNMGHRIETAGGRYPVGSPLPCFECHNPHGSTRGNRSLISDERGRLLETSTSAGVRAFCFTCHSSSDPTPQVWNSVTQTYTAVSTTETVVGLRRDGTGGNRLRIPAAAGHLRTDTQSCYGCHGQSYAPGGSNVHNPSGGASAGGVACYPCHAFRESMEDNLLSQTGGASRLQNYGHVMGSSLFDGDRAFPFGSYPTSTTDVYCLSCHVDHDRFNANRAANLRTSLAASADGTNTDFVAGTGGICIACHSVNLQKDNINRRSDGTTWTPTITVEVYGASAHNYNVLSAFADGTTFRGNCSKCHTDRQPRGASQTGAVQFGLHWDASRRILAALGRGTVPDPFAEERFCFSCHSLAADGMKPVAGRDWFGAAGASMDTTSQNIFREFTTSTNRLFFKPSAEESPTGNMPAGDLAGDTYAGGDWRVRSMSPATSAVTFESANTTTVAVSTGTQTWRRVRFVTPAVAATVSVPSAAWSVSIFSREDNANANAFMRPNIYIWRADNTTRVNIVGPANIGTEFVTTALPGGLQTVNTAAGTAVELRPGDKVVMDLAVQTLTVATGGSYQMAYSWGFNAQGSLTAPVAISWQTPLYGHRVASYMGRSRPSLRDETPAYLAANRHVECEDCHNPHAAGNVRRTVGGTTTLGPRSPLAGVFGARASRPATTVDGTALSSRWVTPTAYTIVTTATFEYEICFRCHSAANSQFAAWGPTDPAATWTNVALEFNPDNAAFHPVMSRVNTTSAPGRTRPARQTIHMRAPWNGVPNPTAGTGVGFQTMTCSDCHRSNIMAATSQGPHGSAIRHVLRGTWPTRRADGAGVNPSADMWFMQSGENYTGLLCNECHNMDVLDDTATLPAFTAHTRGAHQGTTAGICINCHITVPHGGALHGLIGDGGGAVSGMPARYAYQGDKAMMEMWAYGGNPDNRNVCLTDGTGPCGVHSGETGPFWNW